MRLPIARKLVLGVLSACAKLPQPSTNQGIQKWPPAQRRVQFYPRVSATAASTSSSPFSPPRWYLRASRAPFFSTPSSRSSSPLPLGRSRCRIFRLDRYPLDPVRSRLHQADSHSQETRLRQPCGGHAHGLSCLRNAASGRAAQLHASRRPSASHVLRVPAPRPFGIRGLHFRRLSVPPPPRNPQAPHDLWHRSDFDSCGGAYL